MGINKLEMPPIYLDYNATTRIDPQVKDAMLPYLGDEFGNPSTGYIYGQRAKLAIEKAREQVAALVGANPDEIVFNSGGSEGDNQALIGTALANSHRGKHIITMRIEHPAVLNTCRYLEEKLGFSVTYLPVDNDGLIDPEDVRRAITRETILISIMHANNEVGTIQPITEIGSIAGGRGIPFHTDAAQSCGKVPVDVNLLKVNLLTIAGHKLYAPKGVGALFIRRGTNVDSLIHGASQEKGRRAGTENAPYMVGLGKACEVASKDITERSEIIQGLRDRLQEGIIGGLGARQVHLNGHPVKRLPNTLNISIRGISGDQLLAGIADIAASTGAACHAGSAEPSSILMEMGLTRELALGALRLTLGRWSTQDEIDIAAGLIVERAKHLISSGPAGLSV